MASSRNVFKKHYTARVEQKLLPSGDLDFPSYTKRLQQIGAAQDYAKLELSPSASEKTELPRRTGGGHLDRLRGSFHAPILKWRGFHHGCAAPPADISLLASGTSAETAPVSRGEAFQPVLAATRKTNRETRGSWS
jgi:hypothetical protein